MANYTRFQLRGDTKANWLSANPILAEREPALETDTNRYKIGDGVSTYLQLSYGRNTGEYASVYNVTSLYPLPSGFYEHSTAILAVPSGERILGLIITYETASGVWYTERFIGTDVANWVTLSNWEKLPDAGDLAQLRSDLNLLPQNGIYYANRFHANDSTILYSINPIKLKSGDWLVIAYKNVSVSDSGAIAPYFRNSADEVFSVLLYDNTEDGIYKVQMTDDIDIVSIGLNKSISSLTYSVDLEFYAADAALNKLSSYTIAELRRSVLSFNLFDSNEFEIVHGYLNSTGAYDDGGDYDCTMYIPVSYGEDIDIHIVGQPFEGLGWVWGYSDNIGSGAIMLQPCVSEVNRTITIPEGVNFIRLWGQIGKTHEAYLTSLAYSVVKKNDEEYKNIKFRVIGTIEEHLSSDLTSSNHYDQSTGELIESHDSYRSGEFVIPTEWCGKIILNYPTANGSFAVFLYKEDGTYLGCKTANTNVVIDLKDYDSPYKIIVENYKDWTDTKFSFNGGSYIEELLSDVAELKSKTGDITYTKIIATPNASGQDAIRDILNSITDASPSNQYIIYVPKGRWFECDIQGKQYVKIIGEDRDNTVLYSDGLSTDKFIPENYSYGLTPGMPLSEVPQHQKHCFFALKNLDVESLTVEVNDVKYCVHLDATGWSSAKFNNCHFISKNNVNYPIGIGVTGSQSIQVTNCILETIPEGGLGFFAHNWNNQADSSYITFDKCYFKGCGFASIDELGSDNDDHWAITNCISDTGGKITVMVDYNSEQKTYWINPETGEKEPNPQNLPYCIKLNCTGSNVGLLFKSQFPYNNYGTSRPDFEKSIITDYFFCIPDNSYSIGHVVRGYFSPNNIVINNSCPYLGVICNIINGYAYVVPMKVGKIAVLSFSQLYGSSIGIGSMVYVREDNRLTTETTGNPVGIISGDYYGIGRLISFF